MLDLTEITAQLTAEAASLTTITYLENVDTDDVDAHAVLVAEASMPAAYVFSLGEEWLADESISCVTGQWLSRFGVTLIVDLPAGQVSALETSREQILTALAGFEPTGWSPLEPDGGVPVSVNSSRVLWRDTFTTQISITY